MDDRLAPVRLLEQELLRHVEEGIEVSADVLFYAESTCGLAPEGLEAALRDPRFEERDELLALILTPDMGLRTALEPQLRAAPAFSAAEVQALVEGLSRKLTAIHLLIPGENSFDLPVEEGDIDYFVGKFYFDRQLDPALVRALDMYFAPETVIACRLALRLRGASYTEGQKDFLLRFIEKCPAHEAQMIDLFTLMVTLLGQMHRQQPIAQQLLDRRRQLIKKLKEIREFEQKRDHYSMEYLMMQRYPIPHESEAQVTDQLRMMTVITDSILGLPPDPSLQAELRNLGTYGRRADLSELIRKLS